MIVVALQTVITGSLLHVTGRAVRFLHPEEVAYSWWSYMMGAREKNIGWRIDYFLTSQSLNSNLLEATIHPEFMESDHCPVGLKINI